MNVANIPLAALMALLCAAPSRAGEPFVWEWRLAAEPATLVGMGEQAGSVERKPTLEWSGALEVVDDQGARLDGALAVGPFPILTNARRQEATTEGTFRLARLPEAPATLLAVADEKDRVRVRLELGADGSPRFMTAGTSDAGGAVWTARDWFAGRVESNVWHHLAFGISQTWKGDVYWAFLDGRFAAQWIQPTTRFANRLHWHGGDESGFAAPLALRDLRIKTGVHPPAPKVSFVEKLPAWDDDPRLPDRKHVLVHERFDGAPAAPEKAAVREYADGVDGRAIVLRDRASVAFNVAELPTNQGTFAAWFKPLGYRPTDDGYGMALFEGPGNLRLFVRHGIRQSIPFIFGDHYTKNLGWFAPNYPYGADEWVHVILTWTAPQAAIYLNGEPFNIGEMIVDNVQLQSLGEPGWPGRSNLVLRGTYPVAMDELLVLDVGLAPDEARGLFRHYTEPLPETAREARGPNFAALNYYPGEEKLDLRVNLPRAGIEPPASMRIEIRDANGRPLGVTREDTVVDPIATLDLIALPRPLEPGAYHAHVTLRDQAGSEAAQTVPFHRRHFTWLDGVRLEAEPRLMRPWTPLRVEEIGERGQFVGGLRSPRAGAGQYRATAWGREFTLDSLGLPLQITALQEEPTVGGEIEPLLAAPVRLEATGAKDEVLTPKRIRTSLTERAPHDIRWETAADYGDARISNAVRLELDGTLFHTLTIQPVGDTPVKVDALRLVIPLRSEMAKRYHLTTNNMRELKRNGWLPENETGRLWGSSDYWNAGGRLPRPRWGEAVGSGWTAPGRHRRFGSFIPYIWIGDEDRGLAWWSWTDRDWEIAPEADALELARVGDAVELRVNLFQKPVVLDAPRTIVYAITPTPSRPRPPNWRHWIAHTNGRMAPSLWARGCMDVAPKPEYVAAVRASDPLHANPAAKTSRHFHYTDFRSQAAGTPEWEYFKGTWSPGMSGNPPAEHQAQVAFIQPDQFKEYFSHDPRMYASALGIPTGSNLDYRAHLLDFLVSECGWNGIYQDDTYQWLMVWPLHGKGYNLPDGTTQAEYATDWWRESMRRHHAVFERHGVVFPAIVQHTTGAVFLSAMGYATIQYGGEWTNRDPNGPRDWLEKYDPDILRAESMGRQYGLVPTWHPSQMTISSVSTDRPAEYRRAQGSLLLHDIWRFGTHGAAIPGERERMAWATDGLDLRFHPYWAKDAVVATDSPQVLASAYHCADNGETLLAVVNYGEEPCEVTVSLPAAWLAGRTVAVAEPAPVAEGDYDTAWRSKDERIEGREAIRLAIPPRDSRVALIR